MAISKLDLQDVGVHLMAASPNSMTVLLTILYDVAVVVRTDLGLVWVWFGFVGPSGDEVDEKRRDEKRREEMRREEMRREEMRREEMRREEMRREEMRREEMRREEERWLRLCVDAS
jgi:hypothetical protein